jgi:hypothetical protein
LKRLAVVVVCLLLVACASPRDYRERMVRDVASPGKIVAVEIAFARMAREKGQWTAFREFATDDAVMFVPAPVVARDWLRQQKNPPVAVQWQPHMVWMSCDGSFAATKGAWQRPDGSRGYFTTLWRRQRDGDYKWVLDQGDVLDHALAEPDVIATEIADCSGELVEVANSISNPATGLRTYAGKSSDSTLEWAMMVEPDLSRLLRVYLWQDGEKRLVLESMVAAPTTE